MWPHIIHEAHRDLILEGIAPDTIFQNATHASSSGDLTLVRGSRCEAGLNEFIDD